MSLGGSVFLSINVFREVGTCRGENEEVTKGEKGKGGGGGWGLRARPVKTSCLKTWPPYSCVSPLLTSCATAGRIIPPPPTPWFSLSPSDLSSSSPLTHHRVKWGKDPSHVHSGHKCRGFGGDLECNNVENSMEMFRWFLLLSAKQNHSQRILQWQQGKSCQDCFKCRPNKNSCRYLSITHIDERFISEFAAASYA